MKGEKDKLVRVSTPSDLALPGDVAAEAARLMRQSRAENTRLAYASDWRVFTRWCAAAGRRALPATPETIAAYIVALSNGTLEDARPGYRQKRGRKLSTIMRHLASIGVRHRTSAVPSPIDHPAVRELLEGLKRDRRKKGETTRQAAPIELDLLERLIRALDVSTFSGLRDRALILLGYAAALRADSLVALDVTDVRDRGTHLTVILRQEKTEQTGEPRTVGFYSPDGPLSVRSALAAWTNTAAIKDGPLFRPIRANVVTDERLGRRSVTRIVRAAATRAGIRTLEDLRGHSLRAGFITTADANGAALSAIMQVTGHARPETVLKYIRHTGTARWSAAAKAWDKPK